MTVPPLPSPPDLTPDPIAKDLGAYPAVPDGYVSFKGYLGPGVGGIHRIYLDNSFWNWLEIRAKDIVFRVSVPPNHADPRDVFFVRRKAKVVKSQAQMAHEIENQVWGVPDDDPGGYTRPPY